MRAAPDTELKRPPAPDPRRSLQRSLGTAAMTAAIVLFGSDGRTPGAAKGSSDRCGGG